MIRGLDSFPPQDRPDPIPIHLAFDGMVGSAFFAFFIAALFWLLYWLRKRLVPENRWLLRGIVLGGVLSFVAVELGWIVTEEGRQPWVIYGFLRTRQAATTSPLLDLSFLVFVVIYIVLSITMVVLLIRQMRTPLPRMEWAQVRPGIKSHIEELEHGPEVGV